MKTLTRRVGLCCLAGKLFYALDSTKSAVRWLLIALFVDIRCVESVELLVDQGLLTVNEKRLLLQQLMASYGAEQRFLTSEAVRYSSQTALEHCRYELSFNVTLRHSRSFCIVFF